MTVCTQCYEFVRKRNVVAWTSGQNRWKGEANVVCCNSTHFHVPADHVSDNIPKGRNFSCSSKSLCRNQYFRVKNELKHSYHTRSSHHTVILSISCP